MKVSVAMTTYNGQKYIIEQLDSILKQSVPVDEVIITDDCSTDNTVSIVKDFISDHKLNNWNIFVNKKNIGFSHNFFKAISKTTGNIIFLADQDDVWIKNKVEVMLPYFKLDTSIELVASGMMFIDSQSNTDNKRKERSLLKNMKSPSVLPCSFFLGSSLIGGCTYAFRATIRDVLSETKLPDLYRSLGHDWLIAITGAIFGKFVKINDALIKRRIHESNASEISMRKNTILSTNIQNRIIYLQQSIDAHEFLLQNINIRCHLNKIEINRTEKMVAFFDKRLKFTHTGNFFIWISLGFNFFKYYHCSKSFKVAVQLYIADLFYAYNINWKIKNKNIVK